eukprot:1099150-Amorphochlora_amoeboformis.AAC.1
MPFISISTCGRQPVRKRVEGENKREGGKKREREREGEERVQREKRGEEKRERRGEGVMIGPEIRVGGKGRKRADIRTKKENERICARSVVT